MSNSWNPPFVQWVVKTTKLCNLRCHYCYEFDQLGDSSKMQLDQLTAMFENIAEYYRNHNKKMDFVWHGGEPLTVPIPYYKEIFKLQEKILSNAGITFSNSIQTNLTLLNSEILDAFKEKLFQQIGVSIDLFGDQRVNVQGKPSQETVLKNMERLEEEGIDYGCITVLSQKNIQYLDEIYTFFEDIDRSFRILPIYRTSFEQQHDGNSVSHADILNAYKVLFERWLASDSYIQVRPIQDYITNVIRYFNRDVIDVRHYDKRLGEVVYIVDTNGDLYSNADAYDPSLCYGNLFAHNLSDLFQTDGYAKAVDSAHQRMSQTCQPCDYFGACSGYYMAEATPEQRWYNAENELICGVIKPFQDYVQQRFIELDLLDTLEEQLNSECDEFVYEG
jgi:uncharacterized protein